MATKPLTQLVRVSIIAAPFSNVVDRLSRCFRQVIMAQFVIALSMVLICMLMGNKIMAMSAGLGALVAMVNTWLSKRGVQKSSVLAYQQNELGMLPILSAWLQRMILFCVAVIAGVKLFALAPLGIVLGFTLPLFGYFACKMQ